MFALPWLAAEGKPVPVLAMQITGDHHFRRASPSPPLHTGIGLQLGLDRLCLSYEDSTSPFSYRQPDNPERNQIMPFILLSDDELIARLLIYTWTLTTGKTLRGDVPPHARTD